MDRRSFMGLGGAALLARAARAGAQGHHGGAPGASPPAAPRAPAPPFTRPRSTPAALPPPFVPGGPAAVCTPNGGSLRWQLRDGVKVGHLVAAPCENEFAPGLRAECWGYNGSTPGPTLELLEGDRVRIYVTNRLPEPTTVHWHGMLVPNGVDGVSGLNQRPIDPNETFLYEFTVREAGTFLYHSHYDEMVQLALGLVGMIVVHPRHAQGPRVARDFAMMLHEWKIPVGARRPDPMEMSEFNVLTFNGKSFPLTQPLLVGRGERVRIRLGNLGPMDHHPIHLHGLHFRVTATDAGPVPASAQWPENTVLVPVGSVRVIEFEATEPGDWALHCHMTHHVMTQMGHGLPPMVGVDTAALDRRMARVAPDFMSMGQSGMGGMGESGNMGMAVPPNSAPMRGGAGPYGTIDMGGMFTVLQVREVPTAADEEGWFHAPERTVARAATEAELRRDGIDTRR